MLAKATSDHNDIFEQEEDPQVIKRKLLLVLPFILIILNKIFLDSLHANAKLFFKLTSFTERLLVTLVNLK